MTKKQVYYCYKATNQVNGKVYIGFASDPYARWREHKRDAQKGRGYVFHAAIRKHGWENFQFEVICCGHDRREMLEHVEPALIDQYQSQVSQYGYNVRRIAEIVSGQRLSPTTEFKKGDIPPSRKGISHTEETKVQISKTLQELLADPAKREDRRIKSMGNKSRTGQKQSDAEKEKRRVPLEIVSLIRQLRADGLMYSQIAERLNECGYTNKRGGLWSAKSIGSVFERIKAEAETPGFTFASRR